MIFQRLCQSNEAYLEQQTLVNKNFDVPNFSKHFIFKEDENTSFICTNSKLLKVF